MDLDADPEHRTPAFSITSADDIRALLEPLDALLPLTPPMRCPPVFELQFHHDSGKIDRFKLSICGLYGDQPYWHGLVLRTPEAFNAKFNELLDAARMPH
jgi:hypothetical protein